MAELKNAGDPTSEEFAKGPEIGEQIPEFVLPDQFGNPFRYQPNGTHKVLILFHRSASW